MHRIICALVLTLSMAAPAAADVPPHRHPRPVKPVDVPHGVELTIEHFAEALKDKKASLAQALVDERGWKDNLVGGSGQAMEDTYREGANEGWWTRAVPESAQGVTNKMYIVSCDIVKTEDGRVLDRIDMLIVKTETIWKIVGAGEKRAEVLALANRLQRDEPLAPPPKPE